MSKKNSNIEVMVDEKEITRNGETILETVVTIAKKEVGKIVPQGKSFEVLVEDGNTYQVRNVEEGIELLIRNWNLQQ